MSDSEMKYFYNAARLVVSSWIEDRGIIAGPVDQDELAKRIAFAMSNTPTYQEYCSIVYMEQENG